MNLGRKQSLKQDIISPNHKGKKIDKFNYIKNKPIELEHYFSEATDQKIVMITINKQNISNKNI